jgi:hypothetical protein
VAGLSDGSVAVTGSFFGSMTFPGPTPVALSTTPGCNTNDFDVFVARYGANGDLAWARRAGGCSWEEGLGIAVGRADALTVTGRFQSSPCVFGPGEAHETSLSADIQGTIAYDVFVARYGADGLLAWADRAGGPGDELGESIAATGGGWAVSGDLGGLAVFGKGTPAEALLPSGAFLARWDDAGAFAWARAIGVPDVAAVAAAPGADAWLLGSLPGPQSRLVLGAGEPGETTLLAPHPDLFAARFGPAGALGGAVRLDRGPLAARAASALPDGSLLVLGAVPP